MTRTCLCVLALTAALSAAAMPSRSELKKVQSTVNELMADDIAAMKGGKQTPEGAAAKAEELAGLATDEASKFLLLKGAFGLYVQGGKYEEAVAALDRLTAAVKDVPDKVLADIVREKLKRIPRKDGGIIFDLYERIDRRQRFAGEIAALEKKLKESPSDKSVRQQLAVRLAQTDRWTEALGEFARLGGKEADAVKAESSDPAAAADFWWTYQADDEGADAFRAHATELYRKAVADGKLKGLRLALAKKRMGDGESAPAAAPAAPAVAKPDGPAVKSEPAERPAARAKAAVPNRKYDWTVPKNLKKPKTLEFDFGGGETMTFFAVPPCEWTVPWEQKEKVLDYPKTTKITRPFWLAQFPVTVQQFRLFKESSNVWHTDELADQLKGDKDVIVLVDEQAPRIAEYFAWLNETYGHLLPKGWVFRSPTLAEAACAHHGTILSFYDYIRDARRFGWLQAKGIGREFKNEKEMRGKLFDEKMQDYGAIVCDAVRIQKSGQLLSMEKNVTLDRISTPEIAGRMPWDPGIKEACAKVAGFKKVETDAFRYCDEAAPARRYSGFGGLWFDENRLGPHRIRVAVGYDYVGEWKKKNGK